MPAAFVRRDRKRRRLDKQKDNHEQPSRDTNKAVITKAESAERNEHRRLLQAEIAARNAQGRVSSKKRKRLDHYIETKLKREENAELIRRLASQHVDTSLLQSSKTLGRGADYRPPQNGHTAFKQPTVSDLSDESPQVTDSEDDKSTSDWDGFESEREAAHPVVPRGILKLAQPTASDSDDVSDDSSDSDHLSDTDEDTSDSSSVEHEEARPSRSSAFKAWAEAQRNESLDFRPSAAPAVTSTVLANFKPRQSSPDAVLQELTSDSASTTYRQLDAISIERDTVIQAAREALPVVQEEQRIMEAINRHPIVIICGATGSGKTTQVPQMMFENGYAIHTGQLRPPGEEWSQESGGMIGVTQPRRVAAIAVAERVKTELGASHSSRVAHQVRYDTNTTRSTALKFMTDGILLRELHQDFILSRYSAIIIDEAHERSVNTDILIGTLSRIVALRAELTKEDPLKHYPLKIIIMSATLRVADFTKNERLFHGTPPPVIEVEGRQFGVTVHFARRTNRDYENDMVHKIIRAHRKLPPGTILAFLTGQNEILSVMKQLRQTLGDTTHSITPRMRITGDQMPLEVDDMEARVIDSELQELHGLDDEEDDDDFDTIAAESTAEVRPTALRAQILPLYAALPADQQMRVFAPPAPGSRLIVLATNVAETSLTIPGVRYVFDCGRSKEKKYDNITGISTFEVDWISKASAAQRTGRAGRTGPGHCWRLYSSAIYEEHFTEHSVPEVLRTPVESVVLSLKAMSIDNVPNFPFPTPPNRQQLANAEKLLSNLGALRPTGQLTDQGKELMKYPLSPRYGKILLLSAQNKILAHAVALVAALAVGELFLPDALAHSEDSSRQDEGHTSYGRAQALLSRWDDHSDAIKMLTAVAVHADAISRDHILGGRKIAQELFLREKGLSEVHQLRSQLDSILRSQSILPANASQSSIPPPSREQRTMLNQIIAAAYLDQVAIRADLLPNALGAEALKPKRAIEVPYVPLQAIEAKYAFVHPSSVLARLSKDEMPSYIVYSHLSQAAAKVVKEDAHRRVRLHTLTTISGKVLAALAQDTALLQVGKPIGKIEELNTGRRRCWVTISMRTDGSSAEWPLPAWKVEQQRQRSGEWTISKVLSKG